MNNNCYNIENRSIFNKCLIIVSWLVLAASNAISGVALTINWDPADAQDYGTDYYVDGTLTNAEAQIGKNEAGFYQTLSSYLYHYTSTEYDCCDNNNNAGKTLQVASSDVSLTITLVGYYKMVEWSDRDDYVTSRPFAVAEWDRVYKDTKGHELHHFSQDKSNLSKTIVQPIVDSQFYTISSPCDTDPQKANAKQFVESAIDAAASASISSALSNAVSQDNTHIVWPYTTIDTSQDH